MTRDRFSQGLIQVYTGDGKGKTTCALGLALRAVGQGMQVFMIQFLKGWGTGEAQIAAQRLAPDFTLRHFGRTTLVNLKAPDPEDLDLLDQAWTLAREVLTGGEYDMVILDEFNVALSFDLIPPDEALEVLSRRPAWVEVVLTGRYAPPELIKIADLVTEMRPLKHYFEAGVPARRGIEW